MSVPLRNFTFDLIQKYYKEQNKPTQKSSKSTSFGPNVRKQPTYSVKARK